MLLYPAMNKLLEQVPSRYKLVNVVAARARQIAIEAEEQDLMLEDKTVSIAVREIADGNLPDFMTQPVSQEEMEEPVEGACEGAFDDEGATTEEPEGVEAGEESGADEESLEPEE